MIPQNHPLRLFRFWSWLFPLLGLASHLMAQSIGGIPNPLANPRDSGRFVESSLFNQPVRFFPLDGDRLLVHAGLASNQIGQYTYGQAFTLDRSGQLLQNQFHTICNSIFITGPNETVGFMDPRRFNTGIGFPGGSTQYDTLIAWRLAGTNGSHQPFITGLFFDRPYRGDYRDFLYKKSNSTYVYALSYSAQADTLAPHNEIRLFNLNTNLGKTPVQRTVSDRLLEKALLSADRLFVLSRENFNGTLGQTRLEAFTPDLQPLPLNTSGLDANLVQGKVAIFSLLPDGKWLLAGRINQGGQALQALVRLLPDGSEDPTFTKVLPGDKRGLAWDLAADGRVRLAWLDSNELGVKAVMAVVGPNGGIETQVETSLDPNWPVGKAQVFLPGRNAFLFETGALIPERHNGFNSFMHAEVYRFFVGFNQQIFPLVGEGGIQPYSWGVSEARVNRRLKKIVTSTTGFSGTNRRPQIQHNGLLRLQFMVMNPDGSPDPDFKGFMRFPSEYRRRVFQSEVFPEAYVVGGKKLLVGDRTLDNPRVFYFSRYTFDGLPDASFTPFASRSELFERKNGRFLALNYPDSVASVKNFGTISITELDSLGNSLGVRYTLPLSSAFDTLANTEDLRSFALVGEDNQKGIWIYSGIYFNATQGVRPYLIRFDTLGNATPFFLRPYSNNSTANVFFRNERGFLPIVLSDGTVELWMNAATNDLGSAIVHHRLRFASNGTFLSGNTVFSSSDEFGPRNPTGFQFIRRLSDGKFLVRIRTQNSGLFFVRYLANGQFDPSFLPIPCRESWFNLVEQLDDQLIVGLLPPKYDEDPVCGPASKNGIYNFLLNSLPKDKAFVQGKIEQVASPASGCNPPGARTPIGMTLVSASPGGEKAFTNAIGFYSLAVSPGSHQVSQVTQNDFLRRQICPAPPETSYAVALPQEGSVVLNQNFLNQTFDCPRLTLQIGQPRFRLCSRSRFTLRYRNDGQAPESNVRIRLNLPREVRIESASRVFNIEPDSSYVFDIGTLAPGQGGTIEVLDTVACISAPDSMARACFSARMEPLRVCGEVPPASLNWDGAWLDATARYQSQTGQVRFAVYNRGNSQSDSTRLTFTPAQVGIPNKIKLSGGDSLVFFVPGLDLGRYRLQLQQPANCPLGVEGELLHSGRGSATFFLAFQDGWFMNQNITACPVFRFSYDPNEKVVEPIDPVDPGSYLHYTIHFENYGNDTAYTVLITDTLPAGLDIETYQPMGSSHPHTLLLDQAGERSVLNFLFNPIRLPGKRQDSVLSKGQVDFKIRLKPNVALGSEHRNTAHIYFDRNEAIVTNTTVTKVRLPEEPTAVAGGVSSGPRRLAVFPNPTQRYVTLALPPGMENGSVQVRDIRGRLCRSLRFRNRTVLDLSDLDSGVYLIQPEGLPTERLVVLP